jgi:hypothetical protein
VDYKLGLALVLNPDDRSKVQNFFAKSDNGVLLTALIEDPFIAQGLQRNDLSYTSLNLERNEPASVFRSVELREHGVEAYRTTGLVFEDAQRRRIGTMPVAILQPPLQSLNNR